MFEHREEFAMDKDNPSPFVQPFLLIRFRQMVLHGLNSGWFVDIDGKVNLYIKECAHVRIEEHANYLEQATPLLQAMVEEFLLHGWDVTHVGIYKGSVGPTHVLRNGAIFKRIDWAQPL
jgi:hypothetical protein